MKIHVMSEQMLKDILENQAGFKDSKNPAIISIKSIPSLRIDPEGIEVYAEKLPKHVLLLAFDDIDKPIPGYVEFTTAMARTIVDFVEKIKKEGVEIMIVQCEAGISRSAGCGGAIAKWLNGSDTDIFNSNRYKPNMLVYRRMLEEIQSRGYI